MDNNQQTALLLLIADLRIQVEILGRENAQLKKSIEDIQNTEVDNAPSSPKSA